jgi:hypothetical protein
VVGGMCLHVQRREGGGGEAGACFELRVALSMCTATLIFLQNQTLQYSSWLSRDQPGSSELGVMGLSTLS